MLLATRAASRVAPALGFGVLGFGFRGSGLGFRVSGFGFRNSGFWFLVSGFGIRDSDFGFRVSGFGIRVSNFGFRVQGSLFRASGFGFRDWGLGIGDSGLGVRVGPDARPCGPRQQAPHLQPPRQTLSHRTYLSLGSRKSPLPQNRQIIVYYY